MFIPSPTGAEASTAYGAMPEGASLPSQWAKPEHIRHLLFGTPATVQSTIRLLHHLSYAEVSEWSRAMATGRASEVMAILTKRVSVG